MTVFRRIDNDLYVIVILGEQSFDSLGDVFTAAEVVQAYGQGHLDRADISWAKGLTNTPDV
jgi:hypothetical protein